VDVLLLREIAHDGCKLYCSPSLYETLKPEEAAAYGTKLEYGLANEDVFGPTVSVRVLEHYKPFREVLLLHRPSKTLIVADLAFNVGDREYARFSSSMFRLYCWLAGANKCLSLSKTLRFLLAKPDMLKFVPELESTLQSWDFDRVVPCHGGVVETGGKESLTAGTLQFVKDIAYPKPKRRLASKVVLGALIAGTVAVAAGLIRKGRRIE
jgi:hypothetical protein